MIALVVGLVVAASAPAKPALFTGATVGLTAHTGMALLGEDRADGRLGFAAGVSGRMSSPMFVTDVAVGYGLSRASTAIGATPVGLTRHSFSMTAQLHPLFLLALTNTRLGYSLAAFHLDIGGSLEVSTASLPGDSRTRGDLAWHWGATAEFPITDPNRGASFWLGIRFRQTRMSSDLVASVTKDLGDSQFLITLGYYWNWK